MSVSYNKTNFWKIRLIISLAVASCISVIFVNRIEQDPTYHLFADSRILFAVFNFWNVISNLPLLVVGLMGMIALLKNKNMQILKELHLNYFIFFLGIFLSGIGSSYYHYMPDSSTLVWDRLPMTIAFMSFFSIIIGEYIKIKQGKYLLFPLLIVGSGSIAYWYITLQTGHDDLRPYALVQFLPMILIPLIIVLFPSKFTTNKYLWFMLLFYVLAKLLEAGDVVIYNAGQIVSGHTLKHLFASAAPLVFLIGLYKRRLKTN